MDIWIVCFGGSPSGRGGPGKERRASLLAALQSACGTWGDLLSKCPGPAAASLSGRLKARVQAGQGCFVSGLSLEDPGMGGLGAWGLESSTGEGRQDDAARPFRAALSLWL